MSAMQLRSANSGSPFVGENQDDTVLWDAALRGWYVGPGGGGGAVDSVFGRTGVVVAVTGDYDGDQVDNVSTVPGASVSDALEYLLANAGAVASVFSRTGVVVAATGDYDSDQVDNVSNVTGASVSDALETLAATDGFQTPNAKGNLGATPAINFATNRYQTGTLNANATPTFTLPVGYECFLELKQAAAGGPFVVSAWPASVRWTDDTPPVLSTGANKRDLVRFLNTGTQVLGWVQNLNMSP